MINIERKIKNIEREILYYERVYKDCTKLNHLREYLKYYKELAKNLR